MRCTEKNSNHLRAGVYCGDIAALRRLRGGETLQRRPRIDLKTRSRTAADAQRRSRRRGSRRRPLRGLDAGGRRRVEGVGGRLGRGRGGHSAGRDGRQQRGYGGGVCRPSKPMLQCAREWRDRLAGCRFRSRWTRHGAVDCELLQCRVLYSISSGGSCRVRSTHAVRTVCWLGTAHPGRVPSKLRPVWFHCNLPEASAASSNRCELRWRARATSCCNGCRGSM